MKPTFPFYCKSVIYVNENISIQKLILFLKHFFGGFLMERAIPTTSYATIYKMQSVSFSTKKISSFE